MRLQPATSRARLRAITATAVLLLPRLLPAQVTSRGALIVRLGSDTISVERFTRTATRMEGEIVRRVPATSRWHYVADLDARGFPSRVELHPVKASDPVALYRLRGAVTTFASDTAATELTLDIPGRDSSIKRRVPARNGVVLLPESYGVFELWITALRRAHADTATVGVVSPLGGPTGKLPVQLFGTDSAIASVFGSPLRIFTDAQGRIQRVDGTASTVKYIAERVPDADLDKVYASFASRDAAGGSFGTWVSKRDTVRATVGAATLWVDYGRPARRGRAVFAHGVLGDTLWRTGANAATQFRTDRDLELGGRALPAGMYTLWTHIDGIVAELVVNAQTGQWGTQYDRTRDVMRLPMQRVTVAGRPVEVFTIELVPSGEAHSGTLGLRWDETVLTVPFVVR